VPEDLKGRLTAILGYQAAPFRIVVAPTKFIIQ
jgi:hypothetical protein